MIRTLSEAALSFFKLYSLSYQQQGLAMTCRWLVQSLNLKKIKDQKFETYFLFLTPLKFNHHYLFIKSEN